MVSVCILLAIAHLISSSILSESAMKVCVSVTCVKLGATVDASLHCLAIMRLPSYGYCPKYCTVHKQYTSSSRQCSLNYCCLFSRAVPTLS